MNGDLLNIIFQFYVSIFLDSNTYDNWLNNTGGEFLNFIGNVFNAYLYDYSNKSDGWVKSFYSTLNADYFASNFGNYFAITLGAVLTLITSIILIILLFKLFKWIFTLVFKLFRA